ncbi:MAG: hypothetical protein H0T60_14245 [Acidobacteria bacterium]|nr:hypothetical protein [Acidobacteriota bacterium]
MQRMVKPMPKEGTRQRHSQPEYLSVRDFDKLQHYSNRALIWIKLYVELLDDYKFQQLPDDAKFHLVGLMLLAARTGNRLPNDAAYLARQIGANTQIQIGILLQSGFLIPAKRLKAKGQSASRVLAQNRTDKNRADETTTDETARSASVVVGSRYSREQVRRYVENCRSNGQAIESIEALTTTLYKSGDADAQIASFLEEVDSDSSDLRRQIEAARLERQREESKSKGERQ